MATLHDILDTDPIIPHSYRGLAKALLVLYIQNQIVGKHQRLTFRFLEISLDGSLDKYTQMDKIQYNLDCYSWQVTIP